MFLEAFDYQGLNQAAHHDRASIEPAFLVATVYLERDLLNVAPRSTYHRMGKNELIGRPSAFGGGNEGFRCRCFQLLGKV